MTVGCHGYQTHCALCQCHSLIRTPLLVGPMWLKDPSSDITLYHITGFKSWTGLPALHLPHITRWSEWVVRYTSQYQEQSTVSSNQLLVGEWVVPQPKICQKAPMKKSIYIPTFLQGCCKGRFYVNCPQSSHYTPTAACVPCYAFLKIGAMKFYLIHTWNDFITGSSTDCTQKKKK